MRRYGFVWRPLWLAGSLLIAAVAVTMVLLGHWQLDVSERKHFSLQNFGYALQWWAFTIFALGMWTKIVYDRAHADRSGQQAEPQQPKQPTQDQVAYRRYVMPSHADVADDPELARYNAYLASLDERRRS